MGFANFSGLKSFAVFPPATNLSLAETDVRRIVVFRALLFGDMLCAVPALRALRARFPQARIALVGLPWARDFVGRYRKYLDDFIEFPGYPGLPERACDVRRMPAFLAAIQQTGYDLAMQMHGSGQFVNSLVELFGARVTAGYYVPGEYRPAATFMPYPEDVAESDRHLRLMEYLGIAAQGRELEWPIAESDEAELEAVWRQFGWVADAEYVCIHPGARYRSRRWHSERFAATADALYRAGWQIVITGSREEEGLAAVVASNMQTPALNLAGRTSMGALGALLARSRLVVTNDTGISHLAAALRTPSVVIVTGSDPSRWLPVDRGRHRAVMQPIACRPCDDPDCPVGMKCADLVSVDEVVGCALEQIESYAPALSTS